MKKIVIPLAALISFAILAGCDTTESSSQKASSSADQTSQSSSQDSSQSSSTTEEKVALGGNDAGWEKEARTACQGVYVQTEFTEEDWTTARALFAFHDGLTESCWAQNTLVLRNNEYAKRAATPYTYEPGQRYELTKEFRDNYIGLYFWATFYGTYTFDGNLVTLSSPERFSYDFDGGDGRPGAAVVSSNGYVITAEDNRNPAQDWICGDVINCFNGSIINYRHNSGHDPMTVTIDQTNFTFVINSTEEGDEPATVVPHTEVSKDYKPHGNAAGLTAEQRTDAQGYYVQTEFTEDEWVVARSLFQMHTNSEISCTAINELVLTNNDYVARAGAPYTYDAGKRYVLTKQFRDNQIGCIFWATFYGTYTVAGNEATLSEPECFSYIFDGGAGKPRADVVGSAAFYSTIADTTNPAQDWICGEVINAFNGSIINYRHNSGHEAMKVTLDQDNFTFKIQVEE